MYAYGLGTYWPDGAPPGPEFLQGGEFAFSPARFSLSYEYGVDVYRGGGSVSSNNKLPWEYLGPAPDQVGMFQINFKVPPIPEGLPPCGLRQSSSLGLSLSSNNGLPLNAPTLNSQDSIGICVDPASRRN